MMSVNALIVRGLGTLTVWASCTAAAVGGQHEPGTVIPRDATRLRGTPTVKIEVTESGAKRHTLSPQQSAAESVSISIKDGRLFWTRASGQPLTLTTAGDMTYLSSSAEPGRYVRLRKVQDRLTYVEHLDLGSRSVTYWGEVRITLDR